MCQCPNRASFISTCTPLEKSCPTSLRCVNALIGLLSFLPVLTNIIVALVIMCQCPNRASFISTQRRISGWSTRVCQCPNRASFISTILLYYFLNSRMCQCPNRASFISTWRTLFKNASLMWICVNALIGLLSFLRSLPESLTNQGFQDSFLHVFVWLFWQ